jgi:hypothetical protein
MSMRSAQRKTRLEKSKKTNKLIGLALKVFIPLALILTVVLYLKLSTQYWNGHSKMAFVFQEPNGDVGVTILDPVLNEETTLIIPGDTEVTVARNYGTLRIKNIWQLGKNEKLGGSLLAQTLTDSFLFPTNLWSDRDLGDIWQFVFGVRETNIPFGDRLSAGLFVLRINSIDKTEINLAKSQFLHKQTLTDGKPGYVMSGQVNSRLTVYFADNNFADKNLRFSLTDATGIYGLADGVGQVLEVLGGKVVEVNKQSLNASLDCEVSGQNSDAVKKVATLFSCKKVSGKSNFDLEMRIGGEFAKRF